MPETRLKQQKPQPGAPDALYEQRPHLDPLHLPGRGVLRSLSSEGLGLARLPPEPHHPIRGSVLHLRGVVDALQHFSDQRAAPAPVLTSQYVLIDLVASFFFLV